jgi:hypothetical protein
MLVVLHNLASFDQSRVNSINAVYVYIENLLCVSMYLLHACTNVNISINKIFDIKKERCVWLCKTLFEDIACFFLTIYK